MSELALKLIQENIEKHRRGEDATFLDLGNCGMTEVPEEIRACVWLEELYLGYDRYDFEKKEWINSSNTGKPNQLITLPDHLRSLKKLRHLAVNSVLLRSVDSILSEFPHLQALNLWEAELTDLTALSLLVGLQFLILGSTQISDLSLISGLRNLRHLNCSLTQVSDLSPLSDLTALQTLYCSSTEVSDLSPLSGLTALQTLNCSSTQVSDLSPLRGLTALQTFHCSSTEVSDLSPLSGLTGLQTLACYTTQVSDLSPLSGLTALQTLNCDTTQVSDLSPLSGLTALQTFNCQTTQVSDLSPLSGLTGLQTLTCGSTQISDLSPLSRVTGLQTLACGSTQISDLSPLSGLTGLQTLYCSSTQVLDLSPLCGLTALQTIHCDMTQVSDLSPLSGLMGLQTLTCSSTQVSDLSPLSGLIGLQTLTCSSTQVSDLSPLSGLTGLQTLNCSSTQVSDLSPLSDLTTLQTLNCVSTQVSNLFPLSNFIKNGIDVRWRNRFYFSEICIQDCPLICPPTEVAQESSQAVRDYFEELGEDGQKLNEVKVIFLGEASAGKTSLVKRLLGDDFDSEESQTHGIRIRKAPFQMDDGDMVTAHLWDFGGQEVMHATHQFFLSQRSVYVLLLNSRNDDQAEKWLKHAASFGGRSPVLVVLNKIDENPSFQVDNKRLKEKYPQIRDFFRLSAKTDKGLDEFREALRSEIDGADTRRTPFPKHWLAVKEHFSHMETDYIESAEYRKICESKGVTRPFSQDVLLKFLHDLGVVINFDKLKNFDTQILNPLWLTNGVYRIINSEKVANDGGLLREDDFNTVINDPRYRKENTSDRVFTYPKNKLQYIVRVMQEFELCFMLDARTYVVPQLLPVQEPDFQAEGAMLHFVIHFPDFLPDSIFPRLMVKLHTYIDGDRRWRTGMVLHKPNIFKALARVRWDKEDQKIRVDVCGEERRRFLSFIRETVKEIVDDFTNLNVEEMVPIPETEEFFEYQYLVEAEKAGEKDLFVKQLKKRIPLVDLLDGVEEPAMRDEIEQLPVRAFVSYAHKDLEYLKELRTALAPLMRLQKLQLWDDRDIDAGDEWEKVLFQQLEESDIVLCLVSADFIASEFCYKKEFMAAMEAHSKGEKTIVPIWLRPCDLDDSPVAKLQSTNNEWITSAKNRDEVWTKVSKSLRPALDKAKQRKKILLEKRRGM